ncbi:MAG TPA: hypothetical protein VJP05_09095, partial [Acidimicrobiia bacterium]|nr:hypothetical protein [Acidimicrobiia bacterium]
GSSGGAVRFRHYLERFSFFACRFSFSVCDACFFVALAPLSLLAIESTSLETTPGLYATPPR